ncbi:hypothetical protein CDD82_4829 [Ophiocordyceps australis]|uniref:DASH complex subunit DAM1 n=1 Tax=Ophiocordyceps australis TaxID=1399860 RepID=A0A2C5Z3U9_9HYPO|nr:hypothetical protein CDD82_4829 [Ophiocordyceps australis]
MAAGAPDFANRPNSRTRPVSSRPTTPLRPSSRASLCQSAHSQGHNHGFSPVNVLEPSFAELSDAMADLEANMMHFQLMHESLARFSESFASFLYGLNMNAFCVDFPEGPVNESFSRDRPHSHPRRPEIDTEATFMTTDTSFIESPLRIDKSHGTRPSVAPEGRQSRLPYASRGVSSSDKTTVRGRGRSSGLARPRGRGVREA